MGLHLAIPNVNHEPQPKPDHAPFPDLIHARTPVPALNLTSKQNTNLRSLGSSPITSATPNSEGHQQPHHRPILTLDPEPAHNPDPRPNLILNHSAHRRRKRRKKGSAHGNQNSTPFQESAATGPSSCSCTTYNSTQQLVTVPYHKYETLYTHCHVTNVCIRSDATGRAKLHYFSPVNGTFPQEFRTCPNNYWIR